MKKLICIFSCLLAFLLFSCTDKLVINSCPPIYSLDTVVSVTFYNVDNYNEYYKDIKKIYNDVNRYCSDYDEASLLYKLNINREVEKNEILSEIITYSVNYMNETNGFYNPFIGRLSHLWKDSIDNKKMPIDSEIKKELEIMKSTSVEFVDNKIILLGDGNLDLGGIAKGYATYKAVSYLKEKGITRYLIDAGSSNIAFGDKNNNDFKIALAKPYSEGYITVINSRNLCIGTSSGENQNTIINDERIHHLINPFTGYPSNIYDSISVIGQNSMDLDVYSTALFSMDIDTIKSFIDEKHLDIIVFKDDKIIYQSEGCEYIEKASQ